MGGKNTSERMKRTLNFLKSTTLAELIVLLPIALIARLLVTVVHVAQKAAVLDLSAEHALANQSAWDQSPIGSGACFSEPLLLRRNSVRSFLHRSTSNL
jgi:hypothetical protein